MNWRAAFHPSDRISSFDISRIVGELEMSGMKVNLDACGRVTGLFDSSGRDILRGFFAPTDDPAKVLPRGVVELLENCFGSYTESLSSQRSLF